jgi:hypothetical protein
MLKAHCHACQCVDKASRLRAKKKKEKKEKKKKKKKKKRHRRSPWGGEGDSVCNRHVEDLEI